jgi:hypothetical protein
MMSPTAYSRIRPAALSAALCLLLAACGGGGSGDGGGTTAPPVVTPPSTGGAQGQTRIGQWRELILNNDGTINQAEYRRVAANYNTSEMLDYRLGPTAADFGNSNQQRPTLTGPSDQGLWPFGTQPASNPGEPNKCVTSDRLPRSEREELDRGFRGGAWINAGQYLFLPDGNAASQFRFGMSNIRMFDGNFFDTGGLCMRMRASWEPDWWNRNDVSNPSTPEVNFTATSNPSMPLPAVAIARAKGNVGQLAYAAFRDGRIVPMRVGNSTPDQDTRGLQLPAGMVPTAMQVSAHNEFLYVTVWDTNAATPVGRLAVIALRPRQMACCDPSLPSDTRYYWGMPGAWTSIGMKLLGMVELPMAAPTSIDVHNNVNQGNPRGTTDNNVLAVGDLSFQSARDRWFNTPWDTRFGDNYWQQNPQYGYAIIASRAEGKVTFVDLRPLFQFYRTQYMTTAARFAETRQADWPFTFQQRAAQMPVVRATLTLTQPTAVRTGQLTNTIFGINRVDFLAQDGLNREPFRDPFYSSRRAYIATMDGSVRIIDVSSLIEPSNSNAIAEIGRFAVGRNPVNFAETGPLSTAPDDLFVVSRADRSITFAFPNGEIQGVLTDSRLEDPVNATVGVNLAGFGGTGPGRAVFAVAITVADYNGKALTNYGVEARRGNNGSLNEQYPFGSNLFLYGFRQPTPGKPIAVSQMEVI